MSIKCENIEVSNPKSSPDKVCGSIKIQAHTDQPVPFLYELTVGERRDRLVESPFERTCARLGDLATELSRSFIAGGCSEDLLAAI